jgi:hypothetical protein
MSGDRVGRLPLSGLLSQVLVAFTIECDNEFERQMPHRTSNYGSTAGRGAGPWLVSMENRWQVRFGDPAIRAVREALEQLTRDRARLADGLEPPPGGWRAPLRRPVTLPHYPMVLHRGGFPDGS